MSGISIVVTFFGAFLLIVVILSMFASLNELNNKYEKLMVEHAKNVKFKGDVSRLLWNIGNQREKVPANLLTVIKTMSTTPLQYNDDEAWDIHKKIMEKLK